jgi:hypothetical protein
MRTIPSILKAVTGFALLVALATAACGQAPAEGGARVVRLKGSARYTTGNFVFQPIKVGQVLRPGTVIQTSANEGSYVDLALGDGRAAVPTPLVYRPGIVSSMSPPVTTWQTSAEQNVVRIWGDSALGIDKLTTMATGADRVTETQLDLKRGRITGNVKKLAAGSKYEVKLPNGIAGIRGTVFDIQAVGIIKVFVGSMVVAWVDPRTQKVTTQTITGGQSYDANTKEVGLLSLDSTGAMDEVSLALVQGIGTPPAIPLAADRTMIGMSPVGANPDSIPAAATPPLPPFESTGAVDSYLPPVTVDF